ncbi:MAG: cell division protein ZapE [Burkholderiales bacterium]
MPDETVIDTPPGLGVREYYAQWLKRRGYLADAAQNNAVEHLQRLYEQWSDYKGRRGNFLTKLLVHPELPRGVYLWGAVGRGKSFLMDSFYLCLPLERKVRVHFHHFMRDVHREMQELKGTEDPLDALADRLARRYRLICFDEFHVNDIADAMILARLLKRTLARGVVYCMTSNYPPSRLYTNGLKRENFLPAIALIEQEMNIVEVDGGVDYRLRTMEQLRVYHHPLGEAVRQEMQETFRRIADVEEETGPFVMEGREVECLHRAGGVAWFDFKALCGWGRSQHDYLELARCFHTILLSDIPRMGLELADEARRFTLLVDVFYDNKVKLIISAECAPEQLLKREEAARDARIRAMMFEFDRTASRLTEMQTKTYLETPRAVIAAE